MTDKFSTYRKADIRDELRDKYKRLYDLITDDHGCYGYVGTGAVMFNYSIMLFFYLLEHGYHQMANELGMATRFVQLPPSIVNVHEQSWEGLQPLIDSGVRQYRESKGVSQND
ncbi:hypothetical protein VCRA2128O305_10063 [Vibrio crassostreae]|uniref:hypothetical protein n=1 Tax=Vibrio crassostreae TaxID=246167 RepID=UPI0005DCCA71|nr:hypothetical protein [Vibrio crassostreae]RPF10742.1 hypothetical protein EDB14_1834 [Vibrio crassostreae]TCT67634.1 hypothetical protein EDB44_101682 [Vibrio crassostreae]TCT86935.1 hypothetical protein EDB43_10160 [Vibrio crassostreae]TCU07894.1 hypothetical protein EDB47_10260 [Vibrio crassostreae]TDW13300.1 hypothetical protein EDB45_10159 [Vibrio crassostreae]